VGYRLYESAFVGEDHGLYAVSEAELGEDVGDVGLDGCLLRNREAAISVLERPWAFDPATRYAGAQTVAATVPGARLLDAAWRGGIRRGSCPAAPTRRSRAT